TPDPAPGNTGAVYASTNLKIPKDLAFGADGNLYVSSFDPTVNAVLRYAGPPPTQTGPGNAPAEGIFLDTYYEGPPNNFFSTMDGPNGLAFAIDSAGKFVSDGGLFIVSQNNAEVERVTASPGDQRPSTGNTGATFVASSPALSAPRSLLFRPNDGT